jgi:hypothetical protein
LVASHLGAVSHFPLQISDQLSQAGKAAPPAGVRVLQRGPPGQLAAAARLPQPQQVGQVASRFFGHGACIALRGGRPAALIILLPWNRLGRRLFDRLIRLLIEICPPVHVFFTHQDEAKLSYLPGLFFAMNNVSDVGLRAWCLTAEGDPARFDRRVPTVAFTLEGYTPRQVAERLGEAGIFVWDGNYYALAVTDRLGVEESGGMVRVGIAHYNTAAEVDRLLGVVNELALHPQ